MKILQINAVNKIASTGRTCLEMSNYLNSNGQVCFTAFSKGPSVDPEHEYIIGNSLDTKVHGLLSRITGKQGYFSFFATKKLLEFMNYYNPDVVLLRNLHGNYINVPMVLKYLAKKDIATVVVLHDCWFFTGRCCHFADSNCDKWKKKCGNCPALKKWNKSWFFDRSRKMLLDKKKYFSKINKLAVIGVSEWTTNLAKSSIIGNAKIVKRIYNWIDLDVCKPTTSNLREKLNLKDSFVVLGVAQIWNSLKGIDVFIKAAETFPEYKFVMVGKMPEGKYLPPNIISVGVLHDIKELVKYYSMADVFLNPSVQETFGKTTAEAICCGTPVIGYNLTATPELIGEKCGIVVEQDAQQVIDAIKQIKIQTKKHYTDACTSFAKENFAKEKLIEEYIELYKELSK